MNWQDIAVAVIGVAIVAIVVRRVVHRIKHPQPPCCGCSGGCDLYNSCHRPEKRQ